MLKVVVVDHCSFCDGEAYVYSHDGQDAAGKPYPVYKPCYMCHGTGERERRIPIGEFLVLLDKAQRMEPDYAELGKEKPVIQYQDSRDSAGV